MAQPNTIALRFYNTGNDWVFEHVVVCGSERYRINIRRNAYDFQSWIKGYVYSPEQNEWHELVHRPIEGSRCAAISYVCKNANRDLFAEDAEEVLDELRAIVER